MIKRHISAALGVRTMRIASVVIIACVYFAGSSSLALSAPVVVRDAQQQLRVVVVQGTVYGTIDGKRLAIGGASVELQDPNKDAQHRTVASVVTDATGRYAITNPSAGSGYYDVPAGSYALVGSYRMSRVSDGTVAVSVNKTLTRNIDLGTVVRKGGAAPPNPSVAFFVTDRLPNAGANTVDTLFQNGRLIDPCTTSLDCMMNYGMAAPNGPFLVPQKLSNVADLVAQIHQRFPSATSVLVFVHGFNQDFADPFDIGATWLASFDPAEPVIIYSWASNHKVQKYFDDETNTTWGQDHFRDFMLALMKDPDAPKTVNLFAHSMGNRLALGFLDYLASAKPQLTSQIGQAIFAAPDVDSATFFEAIPRVATIAQGLTMYGSDHDNALRLSRGLHGHCRAGLVGCDYAVPNVANFNAIDASMFHCDLLGHGYWLSSDTLHADIVAVLRSGVMTGVTLRPNLKAGSLPSSYVFDSTAPGDTSCQAQATD